MIWCPLILVDNTGNFVGILVIMHVLILGRFALPLYEIITLKPLYCIACDVAIFCRCQQLVEYSLIAVFALLQFVEVSSICTCILKWRVCVNSAEFYHLTWRNTHWQYFPRIYNTVWRFPLIAFERSSNIIMYIKSFYLSRYPCVYVSANCT